MAKTKKKKKKGAKRQRTQAALAGAPEQAVSWPDDLSLVTEHEVREVSSLRAVTLASGFITTLGPPIVVESPNYASYPAAFDVIIHAFTRLEDGLQRVGGEDSDQAEPKKTRQLVLLMAPTNKPRCAIIGRALHACEALTIARKASNYTLAAKIYDRGQSHLTDALIRLVAEVRNETRKTENASKQLADIFNLRLAYLSRAGLVHAAPQAGAYLTEEGATVFREWPDWSSEPEYAPDFQRPNARQRGGPAEDMPSSPASDETGRSPEASATDQD